MGVQVGAGHSSPNRFGTALGNFRSNLNPRVLSVIEGQPETLGSDLEIWLRVTEIFGPEHFFGFSLGSYQFPNTHLREFRSDGSFLDLTFRTRMQYLMLRYDFARPLPWRRGWDYEVGGGFGFLIGARMNVSGYRVGSSGYRRYDGSHSPDYGNLWRLGIGVKRPISDSLVLRFGLRVSYLYYGNFSGKLGDLRSSYYYTRDSGLTIVSPLEAAEATTQLNDPLYGPLSAALVRSKAYVAEGRTEAYVSVGVRF